MNAVFVDTGYLFALEIANDQQHQDAIQPWQSMALPRRFFIEQGNRDEHLEETRDVNQSTLSERPLRWVSPQ